MTACLFGTYDRRHSANRLLRHALAGAGFEVVECHEPLWEERRDKGRRYFGVPSLARLGARYAVASRRLARRWRALAPSTPLVVVGFGGQLDVLLARRLCRPRAGLVFAPLVSLSETLVEDRRVFGARSLQGRALAALDRATFHAADLVLADTASHADYLVELGAPRARVAVWHLGVEPEFFATPSDTRTCRLGTPADTRSGAHEGNRVLFYGRFLPLHGTEIIVEAAARLGERAEFVMIGSGPERARAEGRARAAGARITWRDDVPLAALPGELADAAVVLGVFGAGRKAAMVVPNKVYQAAAAGRPLVTRDGPALREVLQPEEHCLACPPADPEALATTIGRLLDDRALAERLGRAARAHVTARFAPERQAVALASVLAERLGVASTRPARGPDAARGDPSAAGGGRLEPVRTAAVVVSWEGGDITDRCVASLLAQDDPPAEVVVVDNASGARERARLSARWQGERRVHLLLLDDNRQFAGGLNAGASVAFASGAERVLLLNNDTLVAPNALGLLAAALEAFPAAGIAGPRVLDTRRPGRVLSAGERHVLPLLCVPRTILRYRRRTLEPYPATGVMGCALMVTRACFEAVGGFASDLGVYYEDVDFCLAARARGFGAVIVPRAVVHHDGLRGFAAGLTPWAAYLKARNPWLVVRRHGGAATWLTFVPVYAALVGASAALYAVRGRGAVARALARGAMAGMAGAAGGRLAPVRPPSARD